MDDAKSIIDAIAPLHATYWGNCDIPLLAGHFLAKQADRLRKPGMKLSPEAVDAFCAYAWPGNIRELQHVIERAVILTPDPMIQQHSLEGTRFGLAHSLGSPGMRPRSITSPGSLSAVAAPPGASAPGSISLASLNVADAERVLIQHALTASGNNRTKAADLLMTVRPYIRKFSSSEYISDLANGEVCVSLGFSGDVFIAAARAIEVKNGVEIAYSVPTEGALQWFDMMAIPADAPNPEGALAWINFMMEPEIAAANTDFVWYATANKAALPLINPEITGDPAIFPPAEVLAKLFPAVVQNARTDRIVTRLWTTVRTGK